MWLMADDGWCLHRGVQRSATCSTDRPMKEVRPVLCKANNFVTPPVLEAHRSIHRLSTKQGQQGTAAADGVAPALKRSKVSK